MIRAGYSEVNEATLRWARRFDGETINFYTILIGKPVDEWPVRMCGRITER